MTEIELTAIDIFDPKNYKIVTFEDEIKVDNNCKNLLIQYHQYLQSDKTIDPLTAGSMAGGADFFLRDFMIDNRRKNVFAISADLVRGFAGNWYIVNTLEANMVELESFLIGIAGFYNYCVINKVVTSGLAEEVNQACSELDFYSQRIEAFNNLIDDGFTAWNKACPQG